jgi:hypothetical protein
LQILTLVAQHPSNQNIGARLYISKKTVKTHLTRIFAKLAVNNRGEAVRIFLADEPPAIQGTAHGLSNFAPAPLPQAKKAV